MSAWLSEPRSPFVRTGPRERQRAATRERLYVAALAEFRSKGFERANVAEIARAAGVSRPSFYAHFPTLDHVLFELTWRLALAVVRRLEGATGLRATLDRLADALIEAEQSVGDAALFREMISIFVRRPAGTEFETGSPADRAFKLRFRWLPDFGKPLRGAPRRAPHQRPGLTPYGLFSVSTEGNRNRRL